MDVAAYLCRIGYAGSLQCSADTLSSLHVAHTMSVPFENFDIHLGRPISLEVPALYQKIVESRRGGYCFELNGLFGWLLESLGFSVVHLAARVLLGDRPVRPRSHRVLLVTLAEGPWIADVGFGGEGLIGAIPLVPDRVFEAQGEAVRLILTEAGDYRLESRLGDGWTALYQFSLEPQWPDDYLYANYYLSYSPDSFFTQSRLCTMPTPKGRLVLQDRRLKERDQARTRVHRVETLDEYRHILSERFGLLLPDADLEVCFRAAGPASETAGSE